MKRLLSLVSTALLIVLAINTVAFATPLSGGDDLDMYYGAEGAALTDDKTDANDSGEAGDVFWADLSNDYAYIGSLSKFDTIYIDISTGASSVSTLDVYYSDGNGDGTMVEVAGLWSTLSLTAGGASNFTSTGVQTFTFDDPGTGWVTQTLNSDDTPRYWIAMTCGMDCAAGMGSALKIDQISTKSSGGGAAPEFSTYVFIGVLMIAFYAISRSRPRLSGARAA